MNSVASNYMARQIGILLLLVEISAIFYGQQSVLSILAALFDEQIALFPQEKIYLHTDKPYFLSGEQILRY